MQAGLRTLLTDIIDYAGLFPPANLCLDDAIRNYARYRDGEDDWMLARFVCPAQRLTELTPYMDELFGEGKTLRLSVLGRTGATQEEFLRNLETDLDSMASFLDRWGPRGQQEALEVRLPADIADEQQTVSLLRAWAQTWDARPMHRMPTFFESPPSAEWKTLWPAIMRGIAAHCGADQRGDTASDASQSVGFKLRCGGATPSAYPTIEQVASVIHDAPGIGVPLKFTAGLHHPLRHYNEQATADMHGFLNVFVAGILAARGDNQRSHIDEVVETTNVTAWEFLPDGLSVLGRHITIDQIASARSATMTAVGSCSFDEPRDDLNSLGLW